MKQWIAMLLMVGAMGMASAQGLASFFDKTDQLLAAQVSKGLVNYKALAADKTALDALVNLLGNKQSFASTAEEKAFYLNAYNILVIKGLINAYPVKGPLAINGFFDKQTWKINGANLTLNQIENDIVRKKYNDARIHFALVCGAQSCPPLPAYAYRPALLEAQLDKLTKQSIQNNNFIKVDYKKNTAAISKIFEWYKADFEKAKGSVLAYINAYLSKPLPNNATLTYYEYNWSINGE